MRKRKMNDENLGFLERPVVEFWANIKAAIYCLKSPLNYQVGIEYRFMEDRNRRNKYGEPLWYERVTWIGVTGQNEAGRIVPVKTFFGKPRFLE